MNNVTVRIQKKYRDSVRMRLFVFGTLAGPVSYTHLTLPTT